MNLSQFGMAIETLIDLPSSYEFTFRLRSQSSNLELRGWIRWCRAVRTISTSQGKELTVFHSGVEFDNATVEVVRSSGDALQLFDEPDDDADLGALGVQSLA